MNNNFNNVDKVVITSGANGFFDTFDNLVFAVAVSGTLATVSTSAVSVVTTVSVDMSGI